MAKVNYYLKSPASATETPIYLFFSFEGQRLKYAIGKSIHPKLWNDQSQKVRESRKAVNHSSTNMFLKRLSDFVEDQFLKAKADGVRVSPELIRSKLDEFLFKGDKSPTGFFECYDEFLEAQKVVKKHRTIQKFETLRRQLIEFQKSKKYKLTFESINTVFYEKIMVYYLMVALPFCDLMLIASKPKPKGYPKDILDINDLMRAKRIDLGMSQKDVAKIIGVSKGTIDSWENGRHRIRVIHKPKIRQFIRQDASDIELEVKLGRTLCGHRSKHGISMRRLAKDLGIGLTTLLNIEKYKVRISTRNLKKIEDYLAQYRT